MCAVAACPVPDVWGRFLEDGASSDPELQRHLEICPSCRELLERLAVGSVEWLSRTRGSAETSDSPALRTVIDRLVQFDFVRPGAMEVDFLTPSVSPEYLGYLGPYAVLGILGHGGMGVVFKAFDPRLERLVAIKVLTPIGWDGTISGKPLPDRYVHEARAAAAVRHENVITIHGVEELNGLPAIVMDYVPGETLQEKLDREAPLRVREILRIGRQIAAGLAAAHDRGLSHRDVKPANVLIETGGKVVLTDFGLACPLDQETRSGAIAGTPDFMSPEQAQGQRIDHRSDLFSLGVVLYALATGQLPFAAPTVIGKLKRVVESRPVPPRKLRANLPHDLEKLIMRLLHKDLGHRPASADEVERELDRLSSAPAEHDGGWRVSFWLWGMLAVLVVGVLLVGTVLKFPTSKGTLVVEIEDPVAKVSIEGTDIVITGVGVHELRLRPGEYRLRMNQDGQPVCEEVVSVARDGKQVVRVTHVAHVADFADRAESPKLAPYSAVRWDAAVPKVLIGKDWYELLAIDGVGTAEIVAFCKKTYGDRWQKRFDEDLVEVLTRMGHEPGETVTLKVRTPGGELVRTMEKVPMTKENRRAIWQDRVDREKKY